jgi:hypothetical protein
MNSEKIMKPLDELVGYTNKTPLIIELYTDKAVNIIMSEIKKVNGKVIRVFFRSNLEIEIPLAHVKNLAEVSGIKRIKFNGDQKLFWSSISREGPKFDRYLINLVSLSESVPIIVQTINGLKEEDRAKIDELGGKIKDDPRATNPYSAILPLGKIEALAEFHRVTSIRYEQLWQPRSTTKIFLPSTFWIL